MATGSTRILRGKGIAGVGRREPRCGKELPLRRTSRPGKEQFEQEQCHAFSLGVRALASSLAWGRRRVARCYHE